MDINKTTKIIFLIPNLGAGGAERVITILAKAFVQKAYAVDIVLFLNNKVQYEVPPNVNVVFLNALSLKKIDRIRHLRLYFKEQTKEYNNVVVIPFQDNCLKYALAATIGMRIPVIACERNDPYQKGQTGISRFISQVPYYLSSHCVFQTPDARDYYWKRIQKKSKVVYNPLNIPESISWKGNTSNQIVSVGRLDPQKNQKLLIDAFFKLHQEYKEYKLVILGEGSLRKDLEAQISQLELEESVLLCGYSPDIHSILSEAAMFVLSSDYEGMSNALMEALAIGVPTVSTDHPIGGARLMVNDGVSGLLTPVGDSKALYIAMKRLLDNPQYAQELGANAKAVRSQLSVDVICEQWMEIIASLKG